MSPVPAPAASATPSKLMVRVFVPAIAALLKLRVVVLALELISKVGITARLFKVNVLVDETLVIPVTPEAAAIFNVAAPVAVKLNCSILVVLTVAVEAPSVAVNVSEPSPPTNTSPLFKLFDVDASNVSAPEPPVNVLTPVVNTKLAAVLVVAAM